MYCKLAPLLFWTNNPDEFRFVMLPLSSENQQVQKVQNAPSSVEK